MPLADALASRSRLALVRALAKAPEASASELASATYLHLNTVRARLADLESAGAVARSAKPAGRRGRPAARYRLRERAMPRGDELLGLAALLGGALTSVAPKAKQVRHAGFEWGCRWARQSPGRDPEGVLQGAFERLGFAARAEGRRLRLHGCPCPLVAEDDPALVCRLADAVADGILEGTALRVERREHDPATRRCTATLGPAV
jgi:predicted ArsR family transcriptional regulator